MMANAIPQRSHCVIIAFSLLVAFTAAAGYFYYHSQKPNLLQEKEKELATIADLKVQQITEWRRERMNDAIAVSGNHLLAARVRSFLGNPVSDTHRAEILSQMKGLQENFQYRNILLLDHLGEVRLGLDKKNDQVGRLAREAAQKVFANRRITFSDLHQSQQINETHIDIIVPLLEERNGRAKASGILLFRIDPSQFLYPLIRSWPTSSPSAETLLVRREGDEIVYLSDLRYREDAVYPLRFPLGREHLFATRTARGEKGFMEGLDYRNVPVIAIARAVPDTNWLLIAKIDSEEAFFRLRERAEILAVLVCALLALLGTAAMLLWRRQQVRFHRAKEEQEQEKNALHRHYEYLTKYANDIVLLLDEEWNIIETNDRALTAYGHTRDELLRMNIRDLRAPESLPQLENHIRLAMEREGVIFETLHQRKDRSTFPVEVSSRMIAIEGRQLRQSIIRDISERRSAEAKLRESEERYRNIVETSIDVIYDIDLSSNIFYVSPSVEPATGYSPGELIGQHFTILMLAEEIQKMTDALQKVLGGKKVSNLEVRMKRKGGEIICGEFYAVPKVKDGKVVGVTGIGRDITHRKRSEAELELYAQRLKVFHEIDQAVLTAQPPEAIAHVALPHLRLIVPCRRASVMLFDLKNEQALIMASSTEEPTRLETHTRFPLKKIFSPTTIDELRNGRSYLVNDLSPATAATAAERMLVEEGIRAYINVPLVTEGALIGSLTLGADTPDAFSPMETNIAHEVANQLAIAIQQSHLHEEIRRYTADLERQIAERRLAEEAQMRITAAMEQTSDGVIIMDPDGTIRYINAAMEKICGCTRSELIGMHRRAIWPDQTNAELQQAIKNCLLLGEIWFGDISGANTDGTTYTLKGTLSPVRDNAGKVVNAIVIVRDVTQEVKLEKQLRQAQKMEAIGLLAGGIAHDFNNILASILGYSELAREKIPPEMSPVPSYLEQVVKAAERAKDLAKQILTFSRQTEKKRQPLQLGLLLKESLKLLRSSLPSTIEIRTGIRTTVDTVLADPTEIHQVLMNLCTNAAYAMREQGGILEVTLADLDIRHLIRSPNPDLKQSTYLVLEVSDTGVGIPPNLLDRIFEPFFTTKAPGEGTGMGLSVVYGIVKSIDGLITVDSKPGRGTTFRVYLPKIEQKPDLHPGATGSLPRGTEQILFIDDEEPIARYGREMLGHLGYRVVSETNSQGALALFQAQPDAFDLVITDLTMPGMTGIALAEEIARLRPEIPVILCTGLGHALPLQDVPLRNIREILAKPVSLTRFAGAIRKVLDSCPA